MSEIYYEKLAKFLLDYRPLEKVTPELSLVRDFSNKYTDLELTSEINEIFNSLNTKNRPVLANYKRFIHKSNEPSQPIKAMAEDKYYFLEKHHVHDSPLLATLIEFIIISIALLVRLERMHKKHILCGDVSPYTFMYSKMYHGCEPVDLNKALTDPKNVKFIKRESGPYLCTEVPLSTLRYTKYLAPELIDEVRNYRLKKRLELLVSVAKKRNVAVNDLDVSMILKHMKHSITYTNHAEIYSVGYAMNEIFSHSLSKLAYFGYRMNEFVLSKVDPRIIAEANLLLPTSFANPDDERVLGLVNELLEYIHALMQINPEKRVSLQDMIELLESLLKRTSLTRPEDVEEEEMGMEHEDNADIAMDEELAEDAELEAEEHAEEELEEEAIEAELEEKEELEVEAEAEAEEDNAEEFDAEESLDAELEAELEEHEIAEAEELEREETEELEEEELEREEIEEEQELEEAAEEEVEAEEREELEQEEDAEEREEQEQEFNNEEAAELKEEVADHENEEHLEAEKQENIHEGLKEDEKKQKAPDIDSDTDSDTNIDDDDPIDEPPPPRSTFRP